MWHPYGLLAFRVQPYGLLASGPFLQLLLFCRKTKTLVKKQGAGCWEGWGSWASLPYPAEAGRGGSCRGMAAVQGSPPRASDATAGMPTGCVTGIRPVHAPSQPRASLGSAFHGSIALAESHAHTEPGQPVGPHKRKTDLTGRTCRRARAAAPLLALLQPYPGRATVGVCPGQSRAVVTAVAWPCRTEAGG